MSDDAEWVDVNNEWGIVEVRPAVNPRVTSTTRRPFWVSTTLRPSWPPSNPLPLDPSQTPSTPRDAPDRVQPPLPLVPTNEGNGAIIFGVVGGLMGVILVGLLLYMFVLRRKLNKARNTKSKQDYSIRIEDVAHLSSPIDDSSQLYVNTSDLHKLVNSVKAVRKNTPSTTTDINLKPKCPMPDDLQNQEISSELRKNMRPSTEDIAKNGLQRISGKFSDMGTTLQNTWRQARAFRSSQSNEAPGPSMPDIVPNVNDDDDIWSEDSFDSCSIGYEDETVNSTTSRQGSARRSSRSNKINGSNKINDGYSSKKINPPSMPPPPPPSYSSPIYETVEDFSKPKQIISTSNSEYNIVRKAPPPPIGVKKYISENNNSNSAVNNFKTNAIGTSSESQNLSGRRQNPPLPSLPKPSNGKTKPIPPSGPKPAAKPQLLPKLKIGLRLPQNNASTQPTPDTAMSMLSSTPGIDVNQIESKTNNNTGQVKIPNRFENINKHQSKVDNSKEEAEPSNLSVSARRALLEGKGVFPSTNARR